jgi:hypothetical protein
MVAERTGSLSETQEALGHRHASTTRAYVDSLPKKKDKHSPYQRLLPLERWRKSKLFRRKHPTRTTKFEFQIAPQTTPSASGG